MKVLITAFVFILCSIELHALEKADNQKLLERRAIVLEAQKQQRLMDERERRKKLDDKETSRVIDVDIPKISSTEYQKSINFLISNPHKKHASYSGLDKTLQKQEMTEVLLNVFHKDLLPKDFWHFDIRKVAEAKKPIYQCLNKNHSYETFSNNVSKLVTRYVDILDEKKVRDDLVILVDGGFANALREGFEVGFKDGIENLTSTLELRAMQDPYLQVADSLYTNNESLTYLIGSNDEKTGLLYLHLQMIVLSCKNNLE